MTLPTRTLVIFVSTTPNRCLSHVSPAVDSGYFGLKGVLDQPSIGSTRIPSILFCVYQLMFAAITYVLEAFDMFRSTLTE